MNDIEYMLQAKFAIGFMFGVLSSILLVAVGFAIFNHFKQKP